MASPILVDPLSSRSRRCTTMLSTAGRSHTLAWYVPAEVVVTQFGESVKAQLPWEEPVLERRPFQPPVRPPEDRLSVTLVPEGAQPDVAASNPGFPTSSSTQPTRARHTFSLPP